MSIGLLRITNFRNLSAVDMTPTTQGLNILYGHNGSGKTSFLEAIHYLALGRSFRSAHATKLVRFQTDKFSIFSRIVGDFERDIPLGIERSCEGSPRIKMAERDVTNIAELATFLPLRLINSQSHDLFESGPLHRRKYLDWGLFYHSEQFLPCWRQFERALKQRNAILREKKSLSELNAWTEELLKHSFLLDQLRRQYIAALKPLLAELVHTLLGMDHFDMRYQPGWEEGIDLEKTLSFNHQEAYRLGYTAQGPHRADIDLLNQGVAVKYFLSRGQQKLLICAMIVAQGMLLMLQGKKAPIYLIDDLPAELDEHNRKQLLTLFTAQTAQVFITAIDRDTINKVLPTDQYRIPLNMFHVEHGTITQG